MASFFLSKTYMIPKEEDLDDDGPDASKHIGHGVDVELWQLEDVSKNICLVPNATSSSSGVKFDVGRSIRKWAYTRRHGRRTSRLCSRY